MIATKLLMIQYIPLRYDRMMIIIFVIVLSITIMQEEGNLIL